MGTFDLCDSFFLIRNAHNIMCGGVVLKSYHAFNLKTFVKCTFDDETKFQNVVGRCSVNERVLLFNSSLKRIWFFLLVSNNDC